ncbi:hypothetical protein DYB26_009537 [Aphanomyces astaci]|uniref:Uncharacterized protein n=1 Tax=Aphanomyces astaci TaxID=112090 RepID=A0A397FHN9_APHAT|nr:hypothetical protein DYB36_009996 [Aphanomyces astaci]RHY69686.1 hypothetical protein DYB38_007287 [Aphanomyces astaci]RHZ08713.1 hypothetical protein DYB26_009537 [Aphanomyces astaci]RHZ32205.1 hypothetical protein DYB31_011735 [Aphanomyces astaci]
MPPTFDAVLTTPDLVRCVTAFQYGEFHDMQPFRHLKKPSHPSSFVAKPSRSIQVYHVLLSPWLREYGTKRLALLFQYHPHMQDIVVLHAVIFGHLPSLEYMAKHYAELVWTFPEPLLDVAASHNQLHILQFLHDTDHPGCTVGAMNWAANRGHLGIVTFLHAHRSEGGTTKAMDMAAMNGHLDVVKFLHCHRKEGCSTDAMTEAAWNGHLSVVKYLHAHRTEGCSRWTMDRAAWNGHLEVVKFLHTERREAWTSQAMDMAAWNGHLKVIQYLHAIPASAGCTPNALHFAAMNGYLEVVKFITDTRIEGDLHMAIATATQMGQSDIVKYLESKQRRRFNV